MNFMIARYDFPNREQFVALLEEHDIGLELQSYGLDGVMSPAAWAGRVATHKEIVALFSGKVAVHGPFLGLVYNYMDHLLRAAVKERMGMTFDLARTLGAERLVLHTNFRYEVLQFELERFWLEGNVVYWTKEIERYAERGIQVVLENLVEPNPELMVELADRVGSEYFGLCLDVGHVNVFSELSPAEWVERMGKRLFHVHLHDNNGKTDQHLPVGSGTIDFDSLFDALETHAPNVTVSLEVETQADKAFENIREVMERYG